MQSFPMTIHHTFYISEQLDFEIINAFVWWLGQEQTIASTLIYSTVMIHNSTLKHCTVLW